MPPSLVLADDDDDAGEADRADDGGTKPLKLENTCDAFAAAAATVACEAFADWPGAMLPSSVAERPVWSIWIAYLVTLATLNLITLASGDEQGNVFQTAAALSGFAFIAMSGHIWGGAAPLGLGFLAIAATCALAPSVSPLLLGTMWLLSMLILARHYRSKSAI